MVARFFAIVNTFCKKIFEKNYGLVTVFYKKRILKEVGKAYRTAFRLTPTRQSVLSYEKKGLTKADRQPCEGC